MLKRTILEGQVPQEREAGTDRKEFKFIAENLEQVSVEVKKGVTVKAGRLPADSDLPKGGAFIPYRLVANLKLSSANQSTTFPIFLKVRYGTDDITAAGGKENLKLAYLNGTQWKIIDNVIWGSDYYATVSIPDFPGDPPIGTGH
jgi:hypothetical protein